MVNLDAGNMEDIYQLLSQHNFTLVNEAIDHYKCIICQRILINACQAYCGCHYCEKCVDECVRRGATFCPGLTEECKSAKLSNVAINYQKNRHISQLVVKCPEEMCCYESELRNMGDHLRLCGKRSVECPFTDFGCDQGKLAMDRLNEHLEQESYRHSEILIHMIGNLRNELAEKEEIIESMRGEMESLKMEKRVLEQRVDNLATSTTMEIDARLDEMRREWRHTMEQQQMEKRMEKSLAIKVAADFVWTIDNITEKRKKKETLYSEHVKGYAEPYNMYLRCDINADQLEICLSIMGGDSDEWPFKRNITMAITNQMHPKARKAITELCTIEKPNIFSERSDPFIFKWTELSDEGLLHGNRLTVQCFIRDE